jgi:hypothetical protein
MSNYTAPESILVGTLHQMPSQMEQWYLEERLADDRIDDGFSSADWRCPRALCLGRRQIINGQVVLELGGI